MTNGSYERRTTEVKSKKQSTLKRLMVYAGKYRYFTYASCILAAISAAIALIPFYDIWRIIREVLEVRPDFSKAVHIKSYGWQAVIFALTSMIFYIGSLMCSHRAAFRVQANMRVEMMSHIMKIPVGIIETEGTGKIRKDITESSAATETYLAHNLPDKVVSVATPVCLIGMLAFFDWRLGLISLIPAVIAFVLMGAFMMGPKMANDMKEYQNALGNMSGEAVEYIRGIPVVKTFGQTLYSFKRFKQAIDEYEKWTVAYTKNMRVPMTAFTTSANGIFAALIIAAFAFTGHGITDKFIINLLFYIIITSVLTVTLMKVAYAGESKMLVEDALNRVNNIMNIKPLSETADEKMPKDASVEIDNVEFSYDNNSSRKAIDGISLRIEEGSHIALVGPSGGGKTTLASLIARFYDPEKVQ